MNILFLTLLSFDSLNERTIYTDLLREFVKHGHRIYAISPVERRQKTATHVIREDSVTILRLQIGNTQKTNIIEKGISTLKIEPQFKKGIRKYFSDIKFDLVLFSTPPITFTSAIEYVRTRDAAKTYLLLKDIFPQNAVDMGMMSTAGVRGLLYRHFRNQEKKLYSISDCIGCMSQANCDYVLSHNPEVGIRQVEAEKTGRRVVEVCPNSLEIVDKSVDHELRMSIREKYGIPLHQKIFVYGGNLGKPQGIPFLMECLRKCRDMEGAYFLIIGDGTEYPLIRNYLETEKPKNVQLMKRLPKEDYDTMVGACDVGMIFLDHRFTIPNFPSRILSYMAAKIPVLAVTDPNTDIGKTITEGGFGWWCESNDPDRVAGLIGQIIREELGDKGNNGWKYLTENYSVESAYNTIMVNV